MTHKIKKSAAVTFYYKNKGITIGCKLCLKGRKSVLFLNGLCQKPNHCYWYCPLSEIRKDSPQSFINEIRFKQKKKIIQEIKICQSKGISITGGEPLSPSNVLNTISTIKFLKQELSNKFHIHLYTNGINFNDNIASELVQCGLDEIRFHPSIKNFKKIRHALNNSLYTGLELPVIPSKEEMDKLEKKIYLADEIGLSFINLNEFEMCETNSEMLIERKFVLRKNTSASVLNSFENALDLLQKLQKEIDLKLHFCTIEAKDHYQLKHRYYLRAKSIKLPYESITNEGLLEFGQIEGTNSQLKLFLNFLLKALKLPSKLVVFDGNHIKLPSYYLFEEKFKNLLIQNNLSSYIVEILPLRDEYYQITEKIPM